MCDKNSNLNKAILAQVKSFADNNSTFSVHDITRALRTNANAGQLDLPEFETPNAQFKYNIPHTAVKTAFSELLQDGIFTEINLQLNRNFNNVYFEYTAIPIAASASNNQGQNLPVDSSGQTAVNPPVDSSGQTAVNPPVNKITKPDDLTVIASIERYLNNTPKTTPTLKEIQSAIKCNGWTCEDLAGLIAQNIKDYGLQFHPYASKRTVTYIH